MVIQTENVQKHGQATDTENVHNKENNENVQNTQNNN